MNKNLKQYGIGGLLLVTGVILGAFIFSGDKSAHEHARTSISQKEEKIWTCSMHPQIRQDSSGDCPICGMDLIPASQMGSEIDPEAIKMSKTARTLARIETTIVGNAKKESNNVNLSGELKVNEDRVESISANYDGRIERLYINDVGEQVRKGQVIAQIYAPDLQILKEEYILAKNQGNSGLLESVTKKIRNLDLNTNDILAMQDGVLNFKTPVSGVVSVLNVNQGDNIKTDQQLMQIADLSTLWASFDVYQSALDLVSEGDILNINIPNSSSVSAKVDFVSPVLDQKTRSAKARAIVDNNNLKLKPGVFISAELQHDTDQKQNKGSVMIPRSAVLWTGVRSVVYKEIEDESGVYYKLREVKTGQYKGNDVEILSGISLGDVIVSHGAFSIDSEAQLSDKRSMMNIDKNQSSEQQVNSDIDNKLLKYYLELKNALVKDDFEGSKAILKDFQKILKSSVDKNQLLSTLEPTLNSMITSKNIEDLRQNFINLSEEMIDYTKGLNIEPTLYVQYCPMANSNEGAYWLSLDSNIRNPYFGASMLKCGEVREVIYPGE